MGCRCYEIGGPFIGADPDCPAHGAEAQAEQARREATATDQDARMAALEQRVAALEARLNGETP